VGSNYLSINGWASDKRGKRLREIKVFINKVEVGCATVGLSRDDLAQQYPNLADTRPGFSFLVNIPGIKTPMVTITLALITQQEKMQEFEVIYRFDRK